VVYVAGPVALNSPTVLTPPIPQWGPFRCARWVAPFITPPANKLPLHLNDFGLGSSITRVMKLMYY